MQINIAKSQMVLYVHSDPSLIENLFLFLIRSARNDLDV